MQESRCTTHSVWQVMAFSNALLGIVHSMAHKTGAAFSTGHIHAWMCKRNLSSVCYQVQCKGSGSCINGTQRSQEKSDFAGASEKALINSLCEKIDDFNVQLNIPKTLKEFGINEGRVQGEDCKDRRTCRWRCMYRIQSACDRSGYNGEAVHMHLLRNRS